MSDVKAKIVEFDLHSHPNADLLSIAKIRGTGWQCVVKTDGMIGKSLGVYIPIDAQVPVSHPTFKFLADKTKGEWFRIKTIRLRQQLSQGLLLPAPNGAKLGDDLTETLGVVRWDPPVPAKLAGDLVREPGNFQKYTSIENWKNYPSIFVDGDSVRITEKIHGTNYRFGYVSDGRIGGELTYCVGTHRTARHKEGKNLYSQTSVQLGLEEKMGTLVHRFCPVVHFIVFAEIFGRGVQDLTYGLKQTTGLRIFDVLIDHVYQPWEVVQEVALQLGVETVPILYCGPFSESTVLSFRDGGTTISSGGHMREGIVVTAEPEEFHPEIGRKIIKFISDDYLLRSGATDGH